MTVKKLYKLLLVLLAFSLIAIPPVFADQFDEYQVKAVFLLNFCKLSEWPQEAISDKGTFPIAIIGKVASPSFERNLQGKSVLGAKVTIFHIDEPENARGCRVVYIAAAEKHRLSRILRELRQMSALTVSDMEDFCEAGGMIGLLKEQAKISFEVNLAAVRKVRIDVSSRLLQLAKYVYGK